MGHGSQGIGETEDITRDLRRKLEVALNLIDSIPTCKQAPDPIVAVSSTVAVKDVSDYLDARRARGKFLPKKLFSDPYWDILLELFLAALTERKMATSALCTAASIPMTTGLRCISTLLNDELVERTSDQFDKRRVFVRLSDKALSAMEAYFRANVCSSIAADPADI